jgi:uncharacterized protein (DUF362 family)
LPPAEARIGSGNGRRHAWRRTQGAAGYLRVDAKYEANYKIWVPKLKFHNACQITNALKLNVGLLTPKERILYHDDRVDEKIMGLLEVGYPSLVVMLRDRLFDGFLGFRPKRYSGAHPSR